MTSNRPETSILSSSSEPVSAATDTDFIPNANATDDGSRIRSQRSYVPNIFDLVYPTTRARNITNVSIPPAFLQSDAVDSSQIVGKGASFTVFRQALPPGPNKLVEKKDMGGWIVEKVTDAPKRPPYIVYKSARVRFATDGDPATVEDSRAMLSVLTEFHALLHPPLRDHPNIITLLGLAWGSNHAEPLHRLPVLVVEYGDKGTLADVQTTTPFLTKHVKTETCRGIAHGLQALHDQGIIHGDMKPENIIMCSNEKGLLIPKLADFGFAIMESTSGTTPRYIAGTRTWRAPESYFPVPIEKLKATDVYSFGLLVWSVMAGAKDPFSLILPEAKSSEDRFKAIDRLKMSDEVLNASRVASWVLPWMLQTHDRNKSSSIPNQFPMLGQQLADKLANVTPAALRLLHTSLQSNAAYARLIQLSFPRNLDSVFEYTLTKDPDRRDLKAATRYLEDQAATSLSQLQAINIQSGQQHQQQQHRQEEQDSQSKTTSRSEENQASLSEAEANESVSSTAVASPPTGDAPQSADTGPKYTITNTSDVSRTFRNFTVSGADVKENASVLSKQVLRTQQKINWERLGFKYHRYSWQVTRDLDPAIQRIVFNSLTHLDQKESLFFLSACLVNGYGTRRNMRESVDRMIQSAEKGHPLARANLWRLSTTCGMSLDPTIPILSYLKEAALNGSRPALADLSQLDPVQGNHYRNLLKFGYGGVGAPWFSEGQWLHGLTQGSFLAADFDIESLGPRAELSKLIVNLRGDYIIHAAAALGACGLLKPLLEDGTLAVNQRNSRGETAMLCACRSSQPDMVLLLLNNKADASLQAFNGESPLHWLSSFQPTVNPFKLGGDLVERGGAQVNVMTTENISYSPVFNSIDVDFQVPGTPLSWAVHENNILAVKFLLSVGADPNLCPSDTVLSPLRWAAFYHHVDCLKLMVEHLEKTVELPQMTDGNKDRRHAVLYGPLVQHAIHSADTFSMILRNGLPAISMLKVTLLYLQEKTQLIRFTLEHNGSLLHYAAREGHDQAVRFILEHGWLTTEINTPAGHLGRTAILESVRWNHINLIRSLLRHGADPRMLSASPYNESESGRFWSALHIFADEGYNKEEDMILVDDLIDAGVPVDGIRDHDIEAPLAVSIRRNAFYLANHLRRKGASIETQSHKSAMIMSRWPLTILGHTIALNGRYCFDSLGYLLKSGASFVVCPEEGLTALHLCALVPEGLSYQMGSASIQGSADKNGKTFLKRSEFDTDTSRTIARMVLTHFNSPEQLNQRCSSSILTIGDKKATNTESSKTMVEEGREHEQKEEQKQEQEQDQRKGQKHEQKQEHEQQREQKQEEKIPQHQIEITPAPPTDLLQPHQHTTTHETGPTALHLAVEMGNLIILDLLVNTSGVDRELTWFNPRNGMDETAVDVAMRVWGGGGDGGGGGGDNENEKDGGVVNEELLFKIIELLA